MSKQFWTRSVLGTLALGALFLVVFSSVGAQEKKVEPRRITWEYKVVVVTGEPESKKIEEALSKLVEEGWELTNVVGGQPYISVSRSDKQGATGTRTDNTVAYSHLVHYFRRQK